MVDRRHTKSIHRRNGWLHHASNAMTLQLADRSLKVVRPNGGAALCFRPRVAQRTARGTFQPLATEMHGKCATSRSARDRHHRTGAHGHVQWLTRLVQINT